MHECPEGRPLAIGTVWTVDKWRSCFFVPHDRLDCVGFENDCFSSHPLERSLVKKYGPPHTPNSDVYPLEVVPSFLGCRAARDCAHAVWLACQRKSWIRRRTLIAFGRSVSVFVFTDVGRCSRHCLCELIDSRFFLAPTPAYPNL